jgi:putative chitinase
MGFNFYRCFTGYIQRLGKHGVAGSSTAALRVGDSHTVGIGDSRAGAQTAATGRPVVDVGQICAATGCGMSLAVHWIGPLADAMHRFDISTPARQAAFLAQVGHESGRLVYSRELWGPTAQQRGYEGRVDLGNTQPGDGSKYRGRGFLQITGRKNYVAAGIGLGLDLVDHPELLELPENCALSAAWWWQNHGLNQLADTGDFTRITQVINGGMTGYADRYALWEAGKQAFGVV